LNREILRSNNDKTPYELWKGIPINVNHFRVFGRKCYIKREDNKIGKFKSLVDESILVGFSRKIKAYKCYNLRLNKIVENINVNIDETNVIKIREERRNSKRQEEEEEVKEEAKEPEEKQPKVEQEESGDNQQDFHAHAKTPNHRV
jgi:hypothetical protein